MTFPPRKEIGDRLQELRVAAGFASANDFADVLGFNRGTYTGYEQGKGMFSYEKAWKMADALQCSMDELGGRQWPPEAADARAPGEGELIDCYRAADGRGRDAIMSAARHERDSSEGEGGMQGGPVPRTA